MFRINLDSTDWTAEVYTSRYVEGTGTIALRDERGKWVGSFHGAPEDLERLRAACDALLSEFEVQDSVLEGLAEAREARRVS